MGLRYDLTFLVIRLDLGIALHDPYDTGKKGYYNIPKFKDGGIALCHRLSFLEIGLDLRQKEGND